MRIEVSSLVAAISLFAVSAGAQTKPRPASDSRATTAVEGASLFDYGVTWEQFLRSVRQRRLWEDTAARTEISPELVERLKRVSSGLRILIVTEDWCADSVHTVPYVARLAERAGIDLRIVDRTIGKPIMSRYRTLDHRVATQSSY